MLKNLLAEMIRRDVTRQQIADSISVSYGTALTKINGNYEFTVEEARKIKEEFFPDLTIEYLFDKSMKKDA